MPLKYMSGEAEPLLEPGVVVAVGSRGRPTLLYSFRGESIAITPRPRQAAPRMYGATGEKLLVDILSV